MNSSQLFDRKEIESDQLNKLRSLLSALIVGNRFYTKKLETLGANFQVESLGQFFRDFPFTTKSELAEDQAMHPPYGTVLTYPTSRYTRFHMTGSTTGSPIRWLDTPESWDWNVANKARIFDSACVTQEDRVFFRFRSDRLWRSGWLLKPPLEKGACAFQAED